MKSKLENSAKSWAFKLSEMAKIANVGFWEYDVQNDEVLWSDETYRLFDYKNGSKINYESIINRIHPEDRARHDIITRQWIEKGTCQPFEYRILLPNNQIKYVKANGKVEQNKAGKTIRMLGAITDITKQKVTEQELLDYQERLEEKVASRTFELEQNQHLLKTVISEAPIILFAFDNKGIFTLSDGKGLKKLGLKSGQVVGLPVNDVYKDNPEIIRNVEMVLKGEEVRTVNQVGDIYYHTLFTPIKSEKDEVLGVVGVAMDVTDQKQSEIELQKALEYNKKMTETSPVSIIVINKQGEIEFANKRAQNTLGLQKEDITKMAYNDPVWSITDFEGNDFPNDKLPFIRVQEEGKAVFNIQHAIKWPNGRVIYLSINAAPKFDQNNIFDGMIATLENITERVQQERALKEVSSFREMVIKNAAEGLCVCHNCNEFPYVKFTVWNKQIEEITGYTIEEINKLGWYQSLYKDLEIREKAIGRMTNMREGDDILSEEWEITTKSGIVRCISISTSVLSDYNDVTYVLALISDVTERKKKQEQIIQEKDEADKKSDLKSAFLANMSHEIRTPMNAITGFASFLKDRDNTREEIDKYADIIINSGNHLLDLINDVIDISKIQAGQIKINQEKVNVNKLVDQVYSLFYSDLNSKNKPDVHLKINLPEKEIVVLTDETRLKQILINLLSNAIKFTKKGTIEIGYRPRANKLKFYVKDSGIGISEEKQNIIFERFQQENNSTEKNFGGTGLGLAIAKACVELLGGTIGVESKQGVGSTFHFTIEYISG